MKRHIRFDRLFLVIMIATTVVTSSMVGLIKAYKYVSSEQKKNRESLVFIQTFKDVTDEIVFEKHVSDEAIVEEPEAKETSAVSLGVFKLTGYCACEKCCGKWADGITATGTVATEGRTIAVDPNIIPLGSHVLINGHEFVCEDTGSVINQNRIDIFKDSHMACFSNDCNGTAEVFLIG